MGNTNKFFGDFDNGLGLDLWYEVDPFTSNAGSPKWSIDASKVRKHTKIAGSPIYTSMFSQYDATGGSVSSSEFVASSQIFNDDEYANDTSLIAIIEYLQKWKSTYVDYADFAYLKNLGVYPTNRLMIARRFASPTPNNLYEIDAAPMATMVTWMPEDNDFFSVTYGEKWEEIRDASFTSVLNSIGENFSTKGVGDAAEGGFKFFSLPGWTEGIQIEILKKLGYLDYDANNPPSGNPNLIKEASVRSLVDKNAAGTGLTGKFSINFTVEYEQKYINGLDPSLVYMDIIQKAMIFGTSKSVFMFGVKGAKEGQEFIKKLVSGDINAMVKAIGDFIDEFYKAMSEVAKLLLEAFNDIKDTVFQDPNDPTRFDKLSDETKTILGGVISKYRLKIFSVMQALSGTPSGYWHCTIGNPKKPFFSCGDLITTSVTLSFGKVLAYNDLPSTIKITFTLDSARNLGGQEIMDAFNTGQGRTYLQRTRSYVEVPLGKTTYVEGAEGESAQDSADYSERSKKFRDEVDKIKGNKDKPGPKD